MWIFQAKLCVTIFQAGSGNVGRQARQTEFDRVSAVASRRTARFLPRFSRSAMAAAPQVIAQQTASQYRRELGRQPPAYDKSLHPMSDKDINERMVKLDAYDAQRSRENNGKHARKLLQLAKEGRLAAWGGKAAAGEAGVPSCRPQAKAKVRTGHSSRSAEAGMPVVEGAASVGMAGSPAQDNPMPPPAPGVPEATVPTRDFRAAKRQRGTTTPTGSDRSGVQSSSRNSAAEQASAGEVQQPLGFSLLRSANPVAA